MPTPTRPYAAIPADAGKVLRPVLPSLADEIIAAIAREVPDYARAMEGEFGQVVRVAIERALGRFIDLIEDPASDDGRGRAAYVDLGRGEMRAGRSLEALLSAYRLGSRLAWRRFVEAGVAGGLDPGAIYALGEAIFAYIDELSAESAEGYAEEQSAAAGERQRLRRRLVRLLAQDVAPSEETILAAAAAAAWPLPRNVAALVTAPAEPAASDAAASEKVASEDPPPERWPRAGRPFRVGPPRRRTRRPSRMPSRHGWRGASGRRRSGRASSGWRSCWCPTPARPPAPGASPPPPRGARRRSGPRCRSRSPGSRSAAPSPRTRCSPRAGWATGRSRAPRSTCPRSSSPPTPRSARSWPQQRLAPLQTLADGPRARLTETLRAWLDRPGQVQAVAAELGVHPQTVRYRVKQLRELFGDRLEDPEARFELGLALRAGALG